MCDRREPRARCGRGRATRRLSRCVFVHEGVSAERAAAIARFGAEVRRIGGRYDDAVAAALIACERDGWQMVSDKSCPGYERMPLIVMQGYTVSVSEALSAMPEPPTHVFVQAGVGGLAAAVGGYLRSALRAAAPKLIVVEPSRAACLLASHEAGEATKIRRGKPTVMAMLECYEPSYVAWRILERTATAFMTVDEADAVAAMVALARPRKGDAAIVAGESGSAGLAGLQKVLRDPDARGELGLNARSRLLLFNTEGATDPGLYRRLTGLTAAEIAAPGTR